MADFMAGLAGYPLLKDLPPATREMLVEQVIQEIIGFHRWPFLLRVQQSVTWAASDAVQSIPNVIRIINVMFPDSSGDYYRLKEMSDIEFQKWIELNPNETDTQIWRDAGMDGTNYQIELFAAPTSAKALKIDYIAMPTTTNIDTLPSQFRNLVGLGVQAHARPELPYLMMNYKQGLVEAVAREESMQGRRDRVGRDPIQAARMRNVNDPS